MYQGAIETISDESKLIKINQEYLWQLEDDLALEKEKNIDLQHLLKNEIQKNKAMSNHIEYLKSVCVVWE